MELTNAVIKMVYGLDTLKHRREHGLFKVEGTKAVRDMLGHFELEGLYATDAWMIDHPELAREATMVHPRELERMSSQPTPQGVIAVFRLPEYEPFDLAAAATHELVPALDVIQDPGNLGTIIRTADWYGITDIVAAVGTADAFSPKVVQATMGALARVRVHYFDSLARELAKVRGAEVYGTFLGGQNIYEATLAPVGVIVIGNEGRGISAEVEQAVTRRLTIPSYPANRPTSESLNAAIAAAITISEFRRR